MIAVYGITITNYDDYNLTKIAQCKSCVLTGFNIKNTAFCKILTQNILAQALMMKLFECHFAQHY